MADQVSKSTSIKMRYATALIAVIIFVALILFLNGLVYFVITHYFPSLLQYIYYVADGSRAVLAILVSYIVYRILASVATIYGEQKHDPGKGEILKIALRILFWFVVIVIVLTSFGISLAGAFAGGAIGGIVLGLALQTILASILSGFIISSSRAIKSGDVVILQTASWGNILCVAAKVSTVLTEFVTQNGSKLRVPNTMLLNSTIFTNLRHGDEYLYPLPITISADVPLKEFRKKLDVALKERFSKIKHKVPEVYLYSKSGSTNVFNVTITFNDFSKMNSLIDAANDAFDDAYWKVKESMNKH